MKVLHVAAECVPLVKVGGLGDVVGALPKILLGLGVDVSLAIPFYKMIDRTKLNFLPKTELVKLVFDHESFEVIVWQTTLPGAMVAVFLFETGRFLTQGPYDSVGAVDGGGHEDIRFSFFCAAVATWLKDKAFDVIHCHDKHTSLLCKEVKSKKLRVKSVLTIHNLGNKGSDETGLPVGIEFADEITTVSPQYAQEIQTPEFGYGLEGALRQKARQGKLVGILNGLDEDFWNPIKDGQFSLNLKLGDGEIEKFKTVNKDNVFEKLGLGRDMSEPLFVFIGRLTLQKGSDILVSAWQEYAKTQKGKLVVLGVGEEEYVNGLRRLESQENDGKTEKKVVFWEKFDEQLAHELYAGADFFLMPSRFEPCGLTQMIAMRYGAIPTVRDVGGLHDSVSDAQTGLVFAKSETEDLLLAMNRAIGLYQTEEFENFRKRIVKLDWAWEKSAKEYLSLYSNLYSS